MKESYEGVEIVELEPIEGEGFTIIEGFPDVGLVGSIAASFIADRLGMKEVGYVDVETLPPIISVRDGRVLELIRIYRKDNLLAILSDVPIPASIVKPFSRELMNWIESKKPKLLVSLTGIPEPNRLNIDKPKVYLLASKVELGRELHEAMGIEMFKDGFIAGIKGMLLKEGVRRGIDTILISAQSHFNYPDPGSAAEVVKYVSKILNIELDVKPLLESAEELKLRLRDLMRRTNRMMQGVQKSRELELPPVYL